LSPMTSDLPTSFRLTQSGACANVFPNKSGPTELCKPVGGDLSPMTSDGSTSFRLTQTGACANVFPDKSGPTESAPNR